MLVIYILNNLHTYSALWKSIYKVFLPADKSGCIFQIIGSICYIYIRMYTQCVYICDWLWENPPVTHEDNYLEKRN